MKFHAIIAAIFLFQLAGAAAFEPAFAKNGKQLHFGVDGTYPPFSHRNLDGGFTGLEIDIANAVCKSLKVECSLVQFQWDNLVAALRAKKVDLVIATMRDSRENRKLVEFSIPYLQIPSAIIVRKDSILSGLDVEDLRDAQIGVIKSSPHGEYIRIHRPLTHLKLFENEKDYFVDLINKRLDGVIGNPVILDHWLHSIDGAGCCRMLGTLPIDPQINGEGFSIVVAKDNAKLLKKVNTALKSMRASGKSDQIIRSHLPYLR